MYIAIEGCAHGELDQIYSSIKNLERQQNVKVDLLICCGDFQAVRNEADLLCMAVPQKFRHMCSFYKYYKGECTAPILTLFIGGNHEASNYLQELAYGGWVAPNIYYLGYAGVVQIAGLRIAGLSGIYKEHDYCKGHFEKPPYTDNSMRSAYHVRNLEVFRLKQLKEKIDIFISHDWPRGIYNFGDTSELLHWKPFFRDEIYNGSLGSKASESLLHELKPTYWFSAHLHVKFYATVEHNETQSTRFLALDKCLPRRQYLELIEVPHDTSKIMELEYDPHWLAILKATNHLLSVSPTIQYMPGPGYNDRFSFTPTKEELENVEKLFDGNYKIPLNFKQTVQSFDPSNLVRPREQPDAQLNSQTVEFCQKLGIDDPLGKLIGKSSVAVCTTNPDEIQLQEDGTDEAEEKPEGINDLFFIDKKPERNKLSLPKPQHESEPTENIPKQTQLPLHEEKQTTTESPNLEQPVVKKMKRRNQDIYSNPEDY